MRLPRILLSLVFVLALVGACVTATAVTPAPVTPERSTELENGLPGTWFWMASKKAGGEKEEVPNWLNDSVRTYTINADGTVKMGASDGTWSLDGANLTSTVWLEVSRIEELSPNALTLFVYGNSTWMYFERK